MMRICCAVPARPRMTAGIGRCFARSHARAARHGASCISGEKSPPMCALNSTNPKYSSTSASRKFGTASPMKPMKVAT